MYAPYSVPLSGSVRVCQNHEYEYETDSSEPSNLFEASSEPRTFSTAKTTRVRFMQGAHVACRDRLYLLERWIRDH